MVSDVRAHAGSAANESRLRSDPDYQAFTILRLGFTVAPILAGLDKFLGLLADWEAYLSPAFAALSPLGNQTTMYVVGVIEMVAGVVVALRPRFGGWLVAAWLGLIILNLLLLGRFFDVALRDLGLLLGAVALARLSMRHATN